MSGVTKPETSQTAARRVSAIVRLRADQPSSTVQRPSLQSENVSRVSRIPCENTCSLAPFTST